MVQQSLVGYGLLIVEASRSQSDISHSVGLHWTSDRHTTLTRHKHPCPQGDSNPPVPARKLPQAQALASFSNSYNILVIKANEMHYFSNLF